MLEVIIANPKGGCGKTTLATQLASYWSEQGASVALVDHDPQQSALDWLRSRPRTCASIQSVAAYRGDAIPAVTDLAIHDMPAAVSMDVLRDNCSPGARLVIPVLPSPTDIKAGVRFLMALNRETWPAEKGIKIALVANRVKANTQYYKVLVAFLEQVNMPLVASIRDTQNYIRAMNSGISIFELPPSRVQPDLEQWQSLLEWLTAA